MLLGIDDTDNPTSRGTGYQARRLGKSLQASGFGNFSAATRHQLLDNEQIEYTSRNSSVCIVLDAPKNDLGGLHAFARAELAAHSATGSNAGIAIAERAALDNHIEEFGLRAKREVLTKTDAETISQEAPIVLEGVIGSGAGVIGALAAIGLHSFGADGRFIWLPNLRQLDGTFAVGELERLLGVKIQTTSGAEPPSDARIEAVDWMRPILKGGRAILLAEEEAANGEVRWHFVDKPTVKALSN